MQWYEVDYSEGGPVWGVPPFEVARLVADQVGYNDDGPFYIDDGGRLQDERHDIRIVFDEMNQFYALGEAAQRGVNTAGYEPGQFINEYGTVDEWFAKRKEFYEGIPRVFDAGWSLLHRVITEPEIYGWQTWQMKQYKFTWAKVADGGLPIMSPSGKPINWSEAGGKGGRNKWLATIVRRRVNEKKRLLAMSNADQLRELTKKNLISYVLYFKMHPMLVRAYRRTFADENYYWDIVGARLRYENGWRGFVSGELAGKVLPMVEQRLESDLRWRRSLAWLDEQYQRGLEYYLLELAGRR